MAAELPVRIFTEGEDDPLLKLRQEIQDAHVRMTEAVKALEALEAEIVVQRALLKKIVELQPDLVIEIAQSIIKTAETAKDEE